MSAWTLRVGLVTGDQLVMCYVDLEAALHDWAIWVQDEAASYRAVFDAEGWLILMATDVRLWAARWMLDVLSGLGADMNLLDLSFENMGVLG